MVTILSSRFFYLLFPLYFNLVLIGIFYNIPDGFLNSLLALFLVITPIWILSLVVINFNFNLKSIGNKIFAATEYKKSSVLLALIVIISGPIDIYINGFKLLDPGSYAEFNGYGRYVRHISGLCWLLVPIAFIFINSKILKSTLILCAIIFPILIVDRNRLFMTFYAIIFCSCIQVSKKIKKYRSKTNYRILILILILIIIFSVLGSYRSGDALFIDSSGDALIDGYLPLNKLFYYVPTIFQQVIIYLTTPLFNFATVVYYDFSNEIFLLSQLSPFDRLSYEVYPYAPIMVQRFNVGTEFYPWLLYGGLPLVALSFSLMLLSFYGAVKLISIRPNIYTLVIFLKISYAMLFMGFGPQFYILLNLSFVLLIFFIWFTAKNFRSLFFQLIRRR